MPTEQRMDFNSKHKDTISKLGLYPSADYTQDDNQFALYEAASSAHIKKGFDKNYEITPIGEECESLLDDLADL